MKEHNAANPYLRTSKVTAPKGSLARELEEAIEQGVMTNQMDDAAKAARSVLNAQATKVLAKDEEVPTDEACRQRDFEHCFGHCRWTGYSRQQGDCVLEPDGFRAPALTNVTRGTAGAAMQACLTRPQAACAHPCKWQRFMDQAFYCMLDESVFEQQGSSLPDIDNPQGVDLFTAAEAAAAAGSEVNTGGERTTLADVVQGSGGGDNLAVIPSGAIGKP